ncbi:phBC6A51 family helix-turn-helix protein [Piscibacillus sp. B03]|uniref:phBC6A51 family helix-turn-helix protein n=1 Tax=Piscibacillus sp. B03 TaxID=3457430 RepID=UPI003FCEDD4E
MAKERYYTDPEYGLSPKEIEIAESVLRKKITGETFQKIAKRHGITDRHLRNIRRKQAFKDYIKERTIEEFEEDQGEVLDALKRKAKQGNIKAIQLYADIVGLTDKTKKVEVKSEINHQKDVSNDELEAELNELKAIIDEALEDDYKQVQ